MQAAKLAGLAALLVVGDAGAQSDDSVCDPFDVDYLDCGLLAAASVGDTSLVLTLIEAGADVNAKAIDGSTPLHSAAMSYRRMMNE